jgi:hypothetical protein
MYVHAPAHEKKRQKKNVKKTYTNPSLAVNVFIMKPKTTKKNVKI